MLLHAVRSFSQQRKEREKWHQTILTQLFVEHLESEPYQTNTQQRKQRHMRNISARHSAAPSHTAEKKQQYLL